MKTIAINSLKPPGAESATFQGSEHGANISFFVVEFSRGKGPKKHRHPYEETFILLDGEIELMTNDSTQSAAGGTIVVIPAGTWHEFKVRSESPVRMINIHPVSRMVTEWG